MSKHFITSSQVFVARRKSDGKFAREGYETGMGKAIVNTDNIFDAQKCTSVVGIMTWMGGHYRQYEAIPIDVTIEFSMGEAVPFPSEHSVWPDRG